MESSKPGEQIDKLHRSSRPNLRIRIATGRRTHSCLASVVTNGIEFAVVTQPRFNQMKAAGAECQATKRRGKSEYGKKAEYSPAPEAGEEAEAFEQSFAECGQEGPPHVGGCECMVAEVVRRQAPMAIPPKRSPARSVHSQVR
jgi:hypothetical protein